MELVLSVRFWIIFIICTLSAYGLNILCSWDELGAWYYETPWYLLLTPCYIGLIMAWLHEVLIWY